MAEQQEEKKPYFEWSGPFGTTMKFGGREVFTIIITALLAIVIYQVIKEHDTNGKVQAAMVAKAIADSTKAVEENRMAVSRALQEQKETTEALIYIMTLDEKARKNINLAKPKRLRELERRDYYNYYTEER